MRQPWKRGKREYIFWVRLRWDKKKKENIILVLSSGSKIERRLIKEAKDKWKTNENKLNIACCLVSIEWFLKKFER